MKKTVLHAALFALTVPMSLYGLGLGQMTVKSALDQPFVAEIELIDVGNAPLTSIKVGIADPENFEQIGLERTAILSLLNFKIEKNAKGKLVIKVYSEERMTEPYMELVVDLTWPQGQLYKAYTVLLDPPGYQLVSSTIQGSATHYKHVTQQTNEPGVVDKTIITTVAHNPVDANDSKKKSTYGPTITNENVWQIAQRYKTSEVILPQVVLAIVGANPDAFKDGNLNGLKVGVRLEIPSTEDIAKVPSELATAEVMTHDKAWNEKSPIDHVLSPPYTSEQTPNKNEGNASPQSTQDSIIPKLNTQEIALPSTMPQLITNNPTTPLNNNPQINQKPQRVEQDATTKAEISITIAAVESVRESNALLTEQLHLLQNQNKKLQQQLDKRDKEMEAIRTQMQVMMKQRQAVASEASSSIAGEHSSNLWPFLLLLVVAAGGAGFAYWHFVFRKRDKKDPAYAGTPLVESKSFVADVGEHSVKSTEEDTSLSKSDEPVVKPTENPSSTVILESIPEVELPENKQEIVVQEKEKKTRKKITNTVVEVPAAEDPVVESPPVVEAPVVEAPVVEAPVAEAPVAEAPVVEAPVVEAPVVEAPVVEAPVVEAPVVEAPVVETPVVETPVVEAPVVEAPVVEAPVVEAPVVETPVVEAPVVEAPVVEAPVVETPVEEVQLAEDAPLEFSFDKEETSVAPEVTKTKAQKNKSSADDESAKEMTLEFESGLHKLIPPKDDEIISKSPDTDETDTGMEFIPAIPLDDEPSTDSLRQEEENDKGHEIEIDDSITQFFSDGEQVDEEVAAGNDDVISAKPEAEKTNLLKSKKALDTLLALAKTYIGMDDFESARHSLDEVLEYGSDAQKDEAKQLLDGIKDK